MIRTKSVYKSETGDERLHLKFSSNFGSLMYRPTNLHTHTIQSESAYKHLQSWDENLKENFKLRFTQICQLMCR
jgi:hypothetical protein